MNNMQDESASLPKINLENQKEASGRESVLIPKINTPTGGGTPPVVQPPQPTKSGGKRAIWLPLATLIGIIFLFLIYNAVVGFLIYRKGMVLAESVGKLIDSAKSQDLATIKAKIDDTRNSLSNFNSSYKLIAWERFVPFVGPFISDVGHGITAGQAGLDAGEIVLVTVQPYADLLGLKGGEEAVLAAKTGEQTTQERIDFVLKTLPDILPKIDLISGKVKIVQEELSQIDPDRYPEKFRGQSVKPQIANVQNLVNETATFIVNGKPFLESAPYLLGMDSPRIYLILFQNDKEIRPTGGFMTAYAIMTVNKAKFNPVASSDIYTLDAQYRPSILAPDPIVEYIKGPYVLSKNWRLRDMNWSPDFAASMEMVLPAMKQAGISSIDGVIAVDTQVLVNLLDVIGPIGVPGFGNFSTKINPECNCAEVIHDLEAFADVEGPIVWDPVSGKIVYRPPHSDNRKKIIGPLMNSILANALGQPKDKLPDLLQAAFKSLIEKHVLFYLLDNKTEAAAADFGVGGTIKNYAGDYLHINDANLGGRKSNLYAYEEVEQNISVGRDGTVTKTLTITYKNPEKQDGWLNSILPNWVRVYVPKGSTLITSEGLEEKVDPYEDLGKTVFAGFFQLRPEGVSKVTFQYTLPFKVSGEYKILIQKQPGTDGFLYIVNLGKHSEEFFLKTDKEIKIGL
jgi:hypothetical protein